MIRHWIGSISFFKFNEKNPVDVTGTLRLITWRRLFWMSSLGYNKWHRLHRKVRWTDELCLYQWTYRTATTYRRTCGHCGVVQSPRFSLYESCSIIRLRLCPQVGRTVTFDGDQSRFVPKYWPPHTNTSVNFATTYWDPYANLWDAIRLAGFMCMRAGRWHRPLALCRNIRWLYFRWGRPALILVRFSTSGCALASYRVYRRQSAKSRNASRDDKDLLGVLSIEANQRTYGLP